MKVSVPQAVIVSSFLLFACLLGLASVDVSAAATTKRRTRQKTSASLWSKAAESKIPFRGQRFFEPQKYQVFRLNTTVLDGFLKQMPMEFTPAAQAQNVVIEVPMPDGKLSRFRIFESPVVAPNLAEEMSGMKTFSGQGIDDPTATARFDWTPIRGFHGFILSEKGTVYVDPLQQNDLENYLVYYKHEYGPRDTSFKCGLDEHSDLNLSAKEFFTDQPVEFSNGASLRTYRLAIAATGEYTAFHGGTVALAQAAITTTVNRLVGIYRREAAISFTLIPTNNQLVYTNGATDPYANDGSVADINANQTNLDAVIGSANYDIGHLYQTSGGGIAATPSVCNSGNKARGLSGLPNPIGDPFVVDYVAHEIGHQFSGQHSYNNSGDGGCTTRSALDAYEPASGATIMSYVGICSPRNLQRNSYDLFSVQSLNQVINERNNTNPNRGGSCGTLTASGNTPPVINALTNITVPRNTPFSLTASASDANDPANQLTYSWEQNDRGPATSSTGAADSDADGNARPIFRILTPTNAASTRNFPSLTYILNNSNVPPTTYTGTSPTGNVCTFGSCITGEILPSIARVMSFRVVVRDNNATAGGATDATMTVTVSNNGPFSVSTQNTLLPVTWNGGTTQNVTWNVNGTTAEAPNVRILLSGDGGQTFPLVLVNSTPNDGSENITVPNVNTTQARIRVEAVGNNFFDVNDVNFQITSPTAAAVEVRGRVLSSNGFAVPNARIAMTDSEGNIRSAVSNSFGFYRFEGVTAGRTYSFQLRHKRFQFTPQIVSINDSISDLNFIAEP